MIITRGMVRKANRIARNSGYAKATKIVMGNRYSIVEAQNSHYTNNAGEVISHPSAYAKKGFSNMNYNHAYCVVELDKSDWTIK